MKNERKSKDWLVLFFLLNIYFKYFSALANGGWDLRRLPFWLSAVTGSRPRCRIKQSDKKHTQKNPTKLKGHRLVFVKQNESPVVMLCRAWRRACAGPLSLSLPLPLPLLRSKRAGSCDRPAAFIIRVALPWVNISFTHLFRRLLIN